MSSGGQSRATVDDQDRDAEPDEQTVRRDSSLANASDSVTPPPTEPPEPVATGEELVEGRTVISKPAGSSHSSVHSASPAQIAAVLQGGQLGHFILEELIGGGGMGAVFRARDTRLDRTVAVKVIPNVGDDPDLQRRFRNEAQSAARLDHPNIARVYDVGRQGKWHYIVFEHIEGVNLRDQVTAEGPLSVDDAVYYTHQVAEALHHASRRGVVHRDIKPSNVLVTREGTTKLVDMGLARTRQVDVTEDQTASGVTLGTFDYISPEQARDPRNADVRSDLYSLGCSLFYMLTGRPPYPGGTMLQKLLNHGATPPPDPRRTRQDVSEALTLIIHKLLEKDPDDRYQSPLELIADLQELAEREDLSRAEGLGTVIIAPSPRWIRVAEQMIPWAVALIILFISVVWLRTTGTGVVSIPGRMADDSLATPTPAKSNATESNEEATEATPEVEETVSPSEPPDVLDVSDSLPPMVTEEPVDTAPEPSPTAPQIVIVTSQQNLVPPDSVQVVETLSAALQAADQNDNIDTIQLADPIIETGPIAIPRDGLTIEGAEQGTTIHFRSVNRLSMERPKMLQASGTNLVLKNVHLAWSVPTEVYDGGCLIELSGKESLELINTTITIENLGENEHVFAFEYRAPSGADLDAPLPTVDVRLTNVIARGQMTLLNLQQVALLNLNWENGLLAISGSLLETVGALDNPAGGLNRIELRLNEITTFAASGLINVRLGPSGAYPILIRRRSEDCLFATPSNQPLITFSGLPDLDVASECLFLTGSDNAYHPTDQNDFVLYAARGVEGETVEWTIDELVQDDPAAWFSEQSVEPNVGAEGAIPPNRPFHLQTPADYALQGLFEPGFRSDSLPAAPALKPPPSI